MEPGHAFDRDMAPCIGCWGKRLSAAIQCLGCDTGAPREADRTRNDAGLTAGRKIDAYFCTGGDCLRSLAPTGGAGFILGQVLLCRSAQPLLDGARALLAMGYDPSAVLVMRREGSNLDDLRTRVGVAAGLTVDETNIRFAPWKPRLSQIGETSIAPFGPPSSPLAAGPFHVASEAPA